ncbi:MAG: hypothetical protein HYZ27_08435, partial [Deltaproteobacteria bacterium]|nr:hypothetical protein [Deltaproteobacteria bacterium]
PGVVSFPNLPRELLRRYPLDGYFDLYVQPQLDGVVGPALGWPEKTRG